MKNETINELFDKWSDIKRQQKDLEELEKAIKQQLEAAIPDNGVKGKVRKEVRIGTTVSYAKAVKEFRELVTKPVQEKLDKVLAGATTETRRVYLKDVTSD